MKIYIDKYLKERIDQYLTDFEKAVPKNVDIDTSTFEGFAYEILAEIKSKLI